MDKIIQIAVPTILRRLLLHLSHYTWIAGHPGHTHMFDSVLDGYEGP